MMSTLATVQSLFQQALRAEIERRKDMLVSNVTDRCAGSIQGLEHAMTIFDDLTDRVINDKPAPGAKRGR